MLKLIYLAVLLVVALLSAALTLLTGKKGRDADMYLPSRALSMGLAMLICGILLGARASLTAADKYTVVFYILSAVTVVSGIAALMCWKNQKVYVLSDTEFTYTTWLGRTYTYRFDEIIALRRNRDSLTLVLKYGKVHIESMAVLSERFREKLVSRFQSGEQAS